MDAAFERLFMLRRMIEPLHKSHLRTQTNQITADTIRTIDLVFNHLPAHFGPNGPPSHASATSVGIPQIEWVSRKLYEEYYCSPIIQRDFGGTLLQPNEFLSQICTPNSSPNRNSLFFLQGDIGSGKTSFINYLITKYGYDIFQNKEVWFIRLNVDLKRRAGSHAVGLIFHDLSKKLFRVLQRLRDGNYLSAIENDLDRYSELGKIFSEVKSRISGPESQNDHVAWFSQIAKRLSSVLEKRLLLIFDNLDWVFHENDRYLFMSDSDTGENPYLQSVTNLVSEFFHGNSIGGLGANAVFVLRTDSYEVLQTSKNLFRGADDSFSDNKNLYKLERPDWNQVVSQRSALLRSTIDVIRPEGLRRSVFDSLQHILQSLHSASSGGNVVSHLEQLASFGLRSVIEFFKQYTWLSKYGLQEEVGPSPRLIDHPPLGLICFMLGNNLLYSQRYSHFPNIYSSRVEASDAQYVNDTLSQEIPLAVKLTPAHPISYWLKRLLLAFIAFKEREQLRAQNVVDVFCEPRGRAYDEGLVRFCLGDFAETHAANLVAVRRSVSSSGRRLAIDDIQLTPRARHCLDRIFDRFYYLQLVIDDFDLPIPRAQEGDFGFRTSQHYGYLVTSGTEYGLHARQMVRTKAIQVTRFLATLAVALECEKKRFGPVFEKLNSMMVQLPSAEAIADKVFDEFRSLQSSRSIDLVDSIDFFKRLYTDERIRLRPIFQAAYGLESKS